MIDNPMRQLPHDVHLIRSQIYILHDRFGSGLAFGNGVLDRLLSLLGATAFAFPELGDRLLQFAAGPGRLGREVEPSWRSP